MSEVDPDETVQVVFTPDELWLLHARIKHEIPNADQWQLPPACVDLSDQIAEAIVLVEYYGQREAALQLTYHDCLVISYWISGEEQSPVTRQNIGREIVKKVHKARMELLGPKFPQADVQEPSRWIVRKILQEANNGDAAADGNYD